MKVRWCSSAKSNSRKDFRFAQVRIALDDFIHFFVVRNSAVPAGLEAEIPQPLDHFIPGFLRLREKSWIRLSVRLVIPDQDDFMHADPVFE